MYPTNRNLCLLITACVEGAVGISLLILPAILFLLLLGLEGAAVEAIFIGRIAGAALLALGVASWMAKTDAATPAQRGLLAGILVYNAAVSILLIYAGAVLKMSGMLLWPTVALHAILAAWCLSLLGRRGIAAPDRR